MSAFTAITRTATRPVVRLRPSSTLPRPNLAIASRRYESTQNGPSDPNHVQRASPAKSSTSPVFYGVGAVLAVVCGYYIFHSDKSPGSGQARQKELRREGTVKPQEEYRDPRDSGVKTLEQKRAKEQGGSA